MFKIFGRHYGTQRFFIMLFLCLILMISMGIYGQYIDHEAHVGQVSSQALYTTEFTWSKTGDSGKVIGLLTDSKHTKAFLVIQNPETSSLKADMYQCFLASAEGTMHNNPRLTEYVFGTTGYVGFYFTDASGFESRVYRLIIRDDSAAAEMSDGTTVSGYNDKSFIEHNQIQIVLNFAASGAEICPALEENNPQPLSILSDMDITLDAVAGSASTGYKGMQGEAQQCLLSMSDALKTIAQNRQTLTDLHVKVPDLPYYIADDRIDVYKNDFSTEPMQFNPDTMVFSDDSSFSGNGGGGVWSYGGSGVSSSENTPDESDSSGSASSSGDSSGYIAGNVTGATYLDGNGNELPYYYLHTNYLFPGAVHFEWQGYRLSGGLLNQVTDLMISGGKNSLVDLYDRYSDWREESVADYSSDFEKTIKYDAWRNENGDLIDLNASTATNDEKRLGTRINEYMSAVNNYLSLKSKYFDTLAKMVDSENAIQSIGSMVSANNGSNKQNLWRFGDYEE